ncbi:hypothetical protein DV738_g2620, partial [Chaetothyriales sp. CBS 135597]
MGHTIRHHHQQLPRLSSPSRTLSLLLHTAGLASFGYSFNYLLTQPSPIRDSYGWHFQYLTIIGLSLATLTVAAATLADLTRSSTLFALKNVLSVCSTPLEVLISLLYWGLRLIDPALVVPKHLPQPPLAPDLAFHLVPALVLVLDLLFLSPPWTISVAPAITLSGAIASAYWCWIELCYSHNGFYPYPLFALLDWQQRTVLFAASAVLMAANTVVLQWLYARVNGVLLLLPPSVSVEHNSLVSREHAKNFSDYWWRQQQHLL